MSMTEGRETRWPAVRGATRREKLSVRRGSFQHSFSCGLRRVTASPALLQCEWLGFNDGLRPRSAEIRGVLDELGDLLLLLAPVQS